MDAAALLTKTLTYLHRIKFCSCFPILACNTPLWFDEIPVVLQLIARDVGECRSKHLWWQHMKDLFPMFLEVAPSRLEMLVKHNKDSLMAYISHALQTFKMGVDLNQLYNERVMVTLDSEIRNITLCAVTVNECTYDHGGLVLAS